DGDVCRSALDCERDGTFVPCIPGWSEIDFEILLTKEQPLGWHASDGLQRGEFPIEGPGVCTAPPGRICFQNRDCGGATPTCNLGQNNIGSGIPPVPEDPFIGALKCVEFDPTLNPAVLDRTNTLKGEATIETTPPGGTSRAGVDVQKY